MGIPQRQEVKTLTFEAKDFDDLLAQITRRQPEFAGGHQQRIEFSSREVLGICEPFSGIITGLSADEFAIKISAIGASLVSTGGLDGECGSFVEWNDQGLDIPPGAEVGAIHVAEEYFNFTLAPQLDGIFEGATFFVLWDGTPPKLAGSVPPGPSYWVEGQINSAGQRTRHTVQVLIDGPDFPVLTIVGVGGPILTFFNENQLIRATTTFNQEASMAAVPAIILWPALVVAIGLAVGVLLQIPGVSSFVFKAIKALFLVLAAVALAIGGPLIIFVLLLALSGLGGKKSPSRSPP